MHIGLSFLVFCISALWVLLEGILAYRDGMLTAYQMMRKYPLEPVGVPFIWHGGMWGDMLIISPVIGFIVGWYSGQWSIVQILTMLIVGMVLSGAMHGTYTRTPFPDSLAWRGTTSRAGWAHFLYMGVALAIIGLFYFCTWDPMPKFLVITSYALALHVAIGNHLLLGWLNERHHFPLCPDFIHRPDPWITTGADCIILTLLTGWAGGAWAGVTILAIYIVTLIYIAAAALWSIMNH